MSEKALQRAQKILKASSNLDNPHLAWILIDLGDLRAQESDLDEAASFYKKALSIRKRHLATRIRASS